MVRLSTHFVMDLGKEKGESRAEVNYTNGKRSVSALQNPT